MFSRSHYMLFFLLDDISTKAYVIIILNGAIDIVNITDLVNHMRFTQSNDGENSQDIFLRTTIL